MMNQEKIQELVSRSQQDDKRAFALLVSEFQPLVFRLAFRLLCDEEEARDITQETFVKVWLSLKTYNQENRLSTCLYKITCNTCDIPTNCLPSRNSFSRFGMSKSWR